MSCSLCRLPFLPAPLSIGPQPPPEDIIEKGSKLFTYFTKAYLVGKNVPFNLLRMEYLDPNMFGVFRLMIFNVSWKLSDQTIPAYHVVCANILRHILNCAEKSDAAVATLLELECVLGSPTTEPDEGSFPHVKYHEAGPEKVDLRKYYFLHDGAMRMAWRKFKTDGFEWAYTKPDIYPRFYTIVAPTRFPKADGTMPSHLPLDVLRALLPYLPNKSFVALLSACRAFRKHALTTFQAAARERVLALGWAVPLKREYDGAPQATRDMGVMLNRAALPAAEGGDWHLYLCNVHRTQSMRARRWIWATAEEVRRAYLVHRAGSPYDDVIVGEGAQRKVTPSKERQALVNLVKGNHMRMIGPPDW